MSTYQTHALKLFALKMFIIWYWVAGSSFVQIKWKENNKQTNNSCDWLATSCHGEVCSGMVGLLHIFESTVPKAT